MLKYQDNLQDRKGNAIANAYVLVRTSAHANASLFADTSGATIKANPTRTDDDGFFSFYAASDHYDLVITLPEGGTKTISDVFLGDGTSGGGSGGGGALNTDWYLVADVLTAAGLQDTIDQAILAGVHGIGYPEVRLLPGAVYQWGDGVAVNVVVPDATIAGPSSAFGPTGGLRIVCSGMCIFDGRSMTTAKTLINWYQAPTTNNYGCVIEGVHFIGTETLTTGIRVMGSCHTVRRCRFDGLLYGLVWATDYDNVAYAAKLGSIGYTEQCIGENLFFRNNCINPITYRDDSTGTHSQRSFRGSGLVGHNVVDTVVSGTYSIVKALVHCFVYMAPMHLDISVPSTGIQNAIDSATINGVAVFENTSDFRNTNWYGVLRSEMNTSTPVTVGKTQQVLFAGTLMGNGTWWRRGTARLCTHLFTQNEAASGSTADSTPILGEWVTAQDASILDGGGRYDTTIRARDCLEVVVRISCPGPNEGRYLLSVAQTPAPLLSDPATLATIYGCVVVNAVLFEKDDLGLGVFTDGGITFGLTSDGHLFINAPGWINKGTVVVLEAHSKAQMRIPPDSPTQRLREDLSYVPQWLHVLYISANVLSVEASQDGFTYGKGQAVQYFHVIGTTFSVYDEVNTGGRTATVVAYNEISRHLAEITVDITLDPTTFGVAIATAG